MLPLKASISPKKLRDPFIVKKVSDRRVSSLDSKSSDSLDVNENFGKVPMYLQKFNLERQKQKQVEIYRKHIEDTVPAGKRLVSEEERQEVLLALYSAKQEVVTLLEQMPI